MTMHQQKPCCCLTFLTWRWLLTCEIVSPLTSINWRTSLGVASEKIIKKISEINNSQGKRILYPEYPKVKNESTYFDDLQGYQWREQSNGAARESTLNEEPLTLYIALQLLLFHNYPCSVWSYVKQIDIYISIETLGWVKKTFTFFTLLCFFLNTKRLRLAHKKFSLFGPLSLIYQREREREKRMSFLLPTQTESRGGKRERERRNITRENEKTKKTCVRGLQIP